jgi:hypothetical protein
MMENDRVVAAANPLNPTGTPMFPTGGFSL